MHADRIRVIVGDDHPAFRQGVRAMLDTSTDIDLIGEAADGRAVVKLARELQPDVVLMDLRMPECNGVDATRAILQSSPRIGVLVLTMFEDDDSVFAAMRAGARGYVLKGSHQEEILRAVRVIASGDAIFGAGIAKRLIGFFASASQRSDPFPELTSREREVLELVARGRNNAAIAAELVLSLKTVRNHVSNIFNKLRVTDRAGAIVRAREAGLGHAPEA